MSAPSATRPRATRAGAALRLVPTTADLVLIGILGLALFRYGPSMLSLDGDPGRHVRVGDDILARGPFLVDRYYWTEPAHPLIHYEWGGEVLVALAHRVAGFPGAIVLTCLVILATFALLLRLMRAWGMNPLLAQIWTLCGAWLAAIRWQVRPLVWTPLGLVLTLAILERPRTGRLALLVPLYALWANLHAGYIEGLAVIGAYLVGSLVEWRASGDPRWLARARRSAAALLLAGVSTLATPDGAGQLPRYVGYLRSDLIVSTNLEYLSPNFHLRNGLVFLAGIVAVVVILAVSPRRPSIPHLLLILLALGATLYSFRNADLFAVTAWPAVGLLLGEIVDRGRLGQRWRRIVAEREATSVPGRWLAIALVIFIPVALATLPRQFDGRRFPVQAVAWARSNGIGPRLFHEFNWGGYILEAWPGEPVFIDGQQFYGEDLQASYIRIATLGDGWRDDLDRRGVQAVLFETDSPLVRELSRDPAWQVVYRDPTATILTRAHL